ncbi:MAG: xanthine dehydrogenase family protein subunit M [Chloroflexi bacterium]|nr:xanthine dehydrogenase family protein subunit M [Chloroflexota bacterium]
MLWERYLLPQSVEEALAILAEYRGQARIVAGGTDLIVELKQRQRRLRALVDITHIRSLHYLEANNGLVRIGATITHAEAAASQMLQEYAPVLSQACAQVGGPQIRNMGTLVGNVVNAQPAADGALALVALEAMASISSLEGERKVPIRELYRGVGLSAVDPSREIVTALEFHLPEPARGSAFQRLARRRALALPILNAAVVLSADLAAQRFRWVRIALGPVAVVPFRPEQTERLLHGGRLGDEALINEVAELISLESNPRDSIRGGREYRKEMVKVLVKRAIKGALHVAGVGHD